MTAPCPVESVHAPPRMGSSPVAILWIMLDSLVILPTLLGSFSAGAVVAQSAPPVFHYSRLTSTFDGLLPIGQSFQIRGAAASDVQSVRAESFGFAGRIPPALGQSIGDPDFCAALNAARSDAQHDIISTNFGWDRSDPSDAEFTLTHPRLYYGRNYVFVFTYYTPVDKAVARKLLAEGLRGVVDSHGDFGWLLQHGLDGQVLDNEVLAVIRKTQQRACGPAVVGRNLEESFDFWRVVRDSLLSAIAKVATRRLMEERLAADTAGLRDQLRSLESNLPKALAADSGVQHAMRRAEVAADSGQWSVVAGALESLKDLKVPETLLDGPGLSVETLRGMQTTIEGLPGATPDAVAADVAEHFRPEDLQGFMTATTVRPYIQTMKETLPFLISLDGGLAYVMRFRQLTPALSVNIKLRRIDFDDPLDKRAEFSFLVGVTTTAPDDLDPDFVGIFNGSNRALLLALGIRSPRVSSLLRLQAGALVFRQRDANPLSLDVHTRVSMLLGLSLNWDALDFAATLIRGRPTLGAGGL